MSPGVTQRLADLDDVERYLFEELPPMQAGVLSGHGAGVRRAADLLARWPTIPVEGRREALGKLVRDVVVLTGDRSGVKGVQGGATNAEITVVPAWT